MKTTFITTVYNEEENVHKLLDSILKQSKMPDEIVIVDGASTDKTVNVIKSFEKKIKQKKINLKLIIKEGNRSVGRNEAIANSVGEIIACSDAGCILDTNWFKNITNPFGKDIDVVAGFYKGAPVNVFQKCLVPYVLVMPDKVDSTKFLPAARSIAFRKSIWAKAGKFPEQYSDNEDYVFAKKLKSMNAGMVFKQQAFVYWIPRKNIWEAFNMFFRFARGDSESGIIRPKVLLIFARYLIGVIILIWNPGVLLLLLIAYLFWAILKSYKYVNDFRAILILSALQITSDIAVLTGTLSGIYKKYGI